MKATRAARKKTRIKEQALRKLKNKKDKRSLLSNSLSLPPSLSLSLFSLLLFLTTPLTDLLLQRPEPLPDLLVQRPQLGLDGLLALRRLLELLRRQLVEQVAEARLDQVEGDLAARAGRARRAAAAAAGARPRGRAPRPPHGSGSALVERDDGAEHLHGLVKGAVAVVRAEPVLLQEILDQEARGLERDLVALGQRVLADQLDDVRDLRLLLQDLPRGLAQLDKLRVERVVKGLEGLVVLGVGDAPVDRGEVLALRELLVCFLRFL